MHRKPADVLDAVRQEARRRERYRVAALIESTPAPPSVRQLLADLAAKVRAS